MTLMKGLCSLLLLSVYTTAMSAVNPVRCDYIPEDTIYDPSDIFEFGPETDELKLKETIKTFNTSILTYMSKHCMDEVRCIADSVFIDFVVNPRGLVDSVWLVSDTPYPFKKTLKFIKNYDFKGPLVDYLFKEEDSKFEWPARSYHAKIKLVLDREKHRMGAFFDYERIKKKKTKRQKL